ncbi:hypothetical protein [Candidatus Glomeribacter gigasporarum]|uniref:hypothetical protein n=1 Tax=Candidatus Glomeribacter gigasporarum TaxID=132144 RepID=UPI0002F675EE|nr:hypothetical protein [Candidatus Glomeribacter gigasporarum]
MHIELKVLGSFQLRSGGDYAALRARLSNHCFFPMLDALTLYCPNVEQHAAVQCGKGGH